jgi:hypothetical protein
LCATLAGQAAAQGDYVTPRNELAGFPIVAGNRDIGIELGVAGAITRFEQDARPYLWNMDLVLAMSVKDGPAGAEVAQQRRRSSGSKSRIRRTPSPRTRTSRSVSMSKTGRCFDPVCV